MKSIYSVIAAAVLALGSAGLYAQAPHYNVTVLPSVSLRYVWAMGLNNLGEIVGYASDGLEGTYSWPVYAILYSNGTTINLGPLIGGDSNEAYDINDNGQIIGSIYTLLSHNTYTQVPFVFSLTEGVRNLTSGATEGLASSINNAGQIVGSIMGPNAMCLSDACAAIFLPNASIIVLKPNLDGSAADINDIYSSNGIGQVTGTIDNKAFLYDNERVITRFSKTICSTGYNYAACINNAGQIAGDCDCCNEALGYLYNTTNGFIYNLHLMIPADMNDSGWIVGLDSIDSKSYNIPVLVINGTSYNLYDLIPSNSSITNLQPQAINNQGWIVANYKQGAVLLTPIPAVP